MSSRRKKPIQSNNTEKTPKGRLVIGLHSCRETLKVRPKDVSEAWIKKDSDSSEVRLILNQLENLRIRIVEKSGQNLDKLGSGHQGLALFVESGPLWKLDAKKQDVDVLIALDEINDPHNLGAIMRSAWLMGTSAVFVTERRAAHMSGTVSKVASGAAEHVALVVEPKLPELFKSLKDQDYWVFGLDGNSESDCQSIEFPPKVLWVVGAEGKGIRKSTASACDKIVKLPQLVEGASFNASVAAALALAESFRQLRTH